MFYNHKHFFRCTSFAFIIVCSSACSDDDPVVIETPNTALKTAIVNNYSNIVYQSYKDSYDAALTLQQTIDAFVTTPTATNFEAAKTSWLEAREPYGQTEAYRFYSGPIDDADGPEGAINAWPLDEAHVDYVETGTGNDDNSGQASNIINNTTDYPSITAEVLTAENENGGEKNISIGYHAIEFLLWGQDFNTSGPGDRPYTDYITDGSGTATNQIRRGTYLMVAAQILVNDLSMLVDAWEDNADNYRNDFEALPSDEALAKMLTGAGILSKSELAGERVFVALDNQDQEDEHSCFSDNTHRDIILNAQGITNVLTGTYTATSGTVINGASVLELLEIVDATLSTELIALTNQSVLLTQQIPVPFDQALTAETPGGSGPIMQTVTSLQSQGDKIAEAAQTLGITISTDLPE